MTVIIKKGQYQTFQLDCKKVVISITTYKAKAKRATRFKIKAKGVRPKANQARL